MPADATYLIEGSYVLTMAGEPGDDAIREGAVAVAGDRIVEVGARADLAQKYPGARRIGGRDRAVLPGFVNAHTHAAMALFRGYADDLPLQTWLTERIWPAEDRFMGAEFVRDASELACIEMLKAGVTAFCDMYFFQDITAEVVTRIGMRATLGSGVIDFPTSTTSGPDDCLAKAERFIARWRGHPSIVPSIAAHSPLTCSAETLGKVRDLANRLDTPVQIHLSETEAEAAEMEKAFGMRPAHYLDSIGFLGERLLASHCVWVDEDEIGLLAARGVSVAHCPESNLKLASGIAPAARMLRAGVRLAIGTDGAASNNDLDVLGELRTASLLAKARAGDATALDARTSLRIATASGARAIGFPEAGTLTPGALADIVVMDIRKPHMTPLYDIHSQIAYAARAADVETVMVGGRVLVEQGRVLSADEDEIIEKARSWSNRIAPQDA